MGEAGHSQAVPGPATGLGPPQARALSRGEQQSCAQRAPSHRGLLGAVLPAAEAAPPLPCSQTPQPPRPPCPLHPATPSRLARGRARPRSSGSLQPRRRPRTPQVSAREGCGERFGSVLSNAWNTANVCTDVLPPQCLLKLSGQAQTTQKVLCQCGELFAMGSWGSLPDRSSIWWCCRKLRACFRSRLQWGCRKQGRGRGLMLARLGYGQRCCERLPPPESTRAGVQQWWWLILDQSRSLLLPHFPSGRFGRRRAEAWGRAGPLSSQRAQEV